MNDRIDYRKINRNNQDSVKNPFGQHLRNLRDKAGISAVRLALFVDVSEATIYGLEQGKRTPNLKMIEKLASALNLTVEDLLIPELELTQNLVRKAQQQAEALSAPTPDTPTDIPQTAVKAGQVQAIGLTSEETARGMRPSTKRTGPVR